MKRFKTPRGAFFLFIAVILVLIAYYLLSLKTKNNEPNEVPLTAVQTVLMRDLERNYPQTPKEVIKYYSEITKCFYNEEYTEEELSQLAMKAKELYDEELAGNKDDETYLIDLKAEIAEFKAKNQAISSYAPSSSTDVFYFKQDGYEFARLYCTYSIRIGTYIQPLEEIFVLRMDENGHWKIYGWDNVQNVQAQ